MARHASWRSAANAEAEAQSSRREACERNIKEGAKIIFIAVRCARHRAYIFCGILMKSAEAMSPRMAAVHHGASSARRREAPRSVRKRPASCYMADAAAVDIPCLLARPSASAR